MKLFPGKRGKWHFRAIKKALRPLSGSRLRRSVDVFNGAYSAKNARYAPGCTNFACNWRPFHYSYDVQSLQCSFCQIISPFFTRLQPWPKVLKILLSAHFFPLPTAVQCSLNTFYVPEVCSLLFPTLRWGMEMPEPVRVGLWSFMI